MNRMIHLICASILIISHGLFLIRSFILIKQHKSPRRADRIILQLSQLFLPLTLITGLITSGVTGHFPPLHVILGISPLFLMFLFRKRSLRRSHPWRLPLLSGILLAGAFLTGVFL